jgi:hypothetical protein
MTHQPVCPLQSRKRPREDDLQTLPIAKKFHSLHLTANDVSTDSSNQSNQTHLNQDTRSLTEARLQGHIDNRSHVTTSSQYRHHSSLHPQYQPSLGNHENPVYYEMNRVLFEAHVSRLNRCSTSTASSTQDCHPRT